VTPETALATVPSTFHTAVRRVRRFPLWISIVGWVLVLANVSGVATMLVDGSGLIPGIGSTGADRQALMMIAARQLGQGMILAFALLYRDVRVLQAVFAMAFIREGIDLWARLESGAGIAPVMVIVMLAIEVAAFVHLGAVASGRISSYRPGGSKGLTTSDNG
jgi:hypothetical protein